jgi:LPS-assembly lipoprotein
MSSPERVAPVGHWRLRVTAALVAAAGLAAVSGCTVQPLYSAAAAPSANAGVTNSIGGELSDVAVKPVNTRVAQQVRNQLIFLLGGGKGQPAQPRYTLMLSVASASEPTANLQVNELNEPTAAILTVSARYTLQAADGTAYSNGRQQFQASYDVPRQEFAALRAKRDAEDRASRELAELLRLSVAQDLSKGPQEPKEPQAKQPKGKSSLF